MSLSPNTLRQYPQSSHLLPVARRCLVLAAAAGLCLSGCERRHPPSDRTEATAASGSAEAPAIASPATIPSSPSPAPKDAGPPPPHQGPWLTIIAPSAAVYTKPKAERDDKIGYVQSGARLAVNTTTQKGDGCRQRWLEVVGGGYICEQYGTLDDNDRRIKFTLRRPDLNQILPYTYARNAKNGTPLYRTVPTREQMQEYEPYLRPKDEKANVDDSTSAGPASRSTRDATAPRRSNDLDAGSVSARVEAGARTLGDAAGPSDSLLDASAPDDTPWWQREDIQDRLHEVKLSDLQQDSDDILALRMVKGFYVAVDKTFHWNGRTWYKTTKGLVAPADRMGIASASDFVGIALGAERHLPIGWVYGGRNETTTYSIGPDQSAPKAVGVVKRFVALPLTGKTIERGKTQYSEQLDGTWVKTRYVRTTNPGPPPEGIGEKEPWIDINLTSQTLVVFRGREPVYATLVSTGKKSKIKEKDHSTPTGKWRIREKHLTTTMDGDGTAAGDLPYSIEDVPYVMYFYRSYAVHGAFWHRNYGVQMSHGCVNLSPLDAKKVFMLTWPDLPADWHGIWSSEDRPGSWVVIHD